MSSKRQKKTTSSVPQDQKSVPGQDQPLPSGQIQGVHQFQGQVIQTNCFPPEILDQFEQIIPGSAQRLLENTIQESEFRRQQEEKALDANITAQQRQLTTAEYQTKGVIRSDVIGQVAGLIVCLACVGGALVLGFHSPEQWQIPCALAAIPTAAVIKAFTLSSTPSKKAKEK